MASLRFIVLVARAFYVKLRVMEVLVSACSVGNLFVVDIAPKIIYLIMFGQYLTVTRPGDWFLPLLRFLGGLAHLFGIPHVLKMPCVIMGLVTRLSHVTPTLKNAPASQLTAVVREKNTVRRLSFSALYWLVF